MSRKQSATRTATALLVALACVNMSACSTSEETLRVCTSLPFEPFQFKDSWQDNNVVGFDVDIMDLVAEEIGRTQEVIDVGFDSIDDGSALESGECHVVAAALTITSPRDENMDFSQPYYFADQALAAKPESDLVSMDDLEGKLLGIQRDTTGAQYAEENQQEFDFDLKTYADLGSLREAVEYDVVDAAINDVPLWTSTVNGEPEEVEIVQRYETREKYGYAVAEGDDELLDNINRVLTQSKNNGKFAAIYEEWIGEKYTGSESTD